MKCAVATANRSGSQLFTQLRVHAHDLLVQSEKSSLLLRQPFSKLSLGQRCRADFDDFQTMVKK